MGQKQAVNCDIATRRHLCVGRLTLGKHHTRTHMCAHAHMGTCHVRTYMRQATVPRRVTVSRRLVETCVGRLTWENIICVLMRSCAHAYVRICVRTYASTHVRMCTCLAHMSARMIFFSQREPFHT